MKGTNVKLTMEAIKPKCETQQFYTRSLIHCHKTVHTRHNFFTSLYIRTQRHSTFKELVPSHTASKGTKPGSQPRPVWASNSYSYYHTLVSEALGQAENTIQKKS